MADCGFRIWDFGGRRQGRQAGPRTDCQLPISSFQLGSRSRESLPPKDLRISGPVAKRSVSFRNFPKLSVSFRFVPLCSVWFRVVPNGFPIAWCRAGSAECGVLSAAGTLGTHFPSSLAWLAAQNG